MKTIYIVFGEWGVYDDHKSWIVKAFTDKNAAKALVNNAESREYQIKKEYGIDSLNYNFHEMNVAENIYDPLAQPNRVIGEQTTYYLEECELDDSNG